jgi:hypothetical protein
VSKCKSKYDRASSVVMGPSAPSSLPLPPPLCSPHMVGRVREGARGWRSRPPTAGSGGGGSVAKGAPKPDGKAPPPVATCGVAEPDGIPLWSVPVESSSPTGRSPSGRPCLRLHRCCRHQPLGCTSCRVVEVLHHHALLLLRQLGHGLGHGRGSCQLCTTDLIDGAAQ